jgi:BASS family bile acid:Na+ symporter
MNDLVSSLLNFSVLVFAVTSMLSVGFSYTVEQIVAPLRSIHAIARVFIANFVLVPLWTFGVIQIVPLEKSLQIGLFLIATAAGAPFLVKLAQAAGENVALSATLLVLLLLTTMIYMPLVAPLVLPSTNISAWPIAKPLLLTMLLPLAIGHFVEAKFPSWAKRLRPVTRKISTIALVALLVTTLAANFRDILDLFGSGAIVSSVLVIGGAFAIGYVMGSSARGTRKVLGLGTSQRNVAAATVVATQGFDDPNILIMVVVVSLVGMALLFPIAWAMRKRSGRHRGTISARPREA